MPSKKTSGVSTGAKVATGLGVAALAAAAAATYYFAGPKGKQHQKQAKAWAGQAKAEMLKKIKGMKTVSKAAYQKAAREVMAKYKQAKNVDAGELAALGKEIQSHWNSISKEVAKLGAKKRTARA